MKTISIFLALINSLVAGLLIMFNLSNNELHQTGVVQTLIQCATFMAVIAFGIITWLASIRCTNSGAVLLGGIVLVVMGAVTVVWTYHLAVVSGHMEYHMIVYGLSLTIQGMASLLGFGTESKTIAIS